MILGYMPNGLIYYQLKAVPEGRPQNQVSVSPNREQIYSNNLDQNKNGHYLKFTFDNSGLINSVTYLGKEFISVPSLLSLIGLSETYLNRLEERTGSNLITNLTLFQSENWAMALYHEWFSEFRYNLKVKLTNEPGMKKILDDVGEHALSGKFLDREDYKKYTEQIDDNIKQLIRDNALQFISDNMNHLPMYYVPATEFK